MKIYTKTGDDGVTGLPGGERIGKNDLRIDCYGGVDELNAALGLAAVAAPVLREALQRVQEELFVIGARLITAAGQPAPELAQAAIDRLEREIDQSETRLPALQNFILPGGSEAAARLHLARTICRRAERLLVQQHARGGMEPEILAYMNRLSDWLFVHARLANLLAGISDVLWIAPR